MRRFLHASVCASLQSAISNVDIFVHLSCHFAILWLNASTHIVKTFSAFGSTVVSSAQPALQNYDGKILNVGVKHMG